MPRPIRRILWPAGTRFTPLPVCPECQRFIAPALWDSHMAMHHENRRGLAEEAKNPPPFTTHNEEESEA